MTIVTIIMISLLSSGVRAESLVEIYDTFNAYSADNHTLIGTHKIHSFQYILEVSISGYNG